MQARPRRQLRERTRDSALCTCAECGHRVIRGSMAAALRELGQHATLTHGLVVKGAVRGSA